MLIPINRHLIDATITNAQDSERRRAIYRFHQHQEPVQRMLNAIEPDSYVMPHRHLKPGKVEAFIALRGRAAVASFDDDGFAVECVVIEASSDTPGVEIVPGTWHALLSLESGTVLYEVIEGPYDATDHKSFAPWAPAADDHARGVLWLYDRLIPFLTSYLNERNNKA